MNFDTDTCGAVGPVLSLSSMPDLAKNASIEVWHQRLGHANYTTVDRMARTNALTGFDSSGESEPPSGCVPCIEGKMHRQSFRATGSRGSRCGQLVHFDTVGRFEVQSLGNNSHICAFVDDYSSMTFVCSMKHKSESS